MADKTIERQAQMGSPMTAAVDFEHEIEGQVKVKALGLPGTVIAQMRDSEGLAYRVVYWSEGSRKTEWLFGWEIERG